MIPPWEVRVLSYFQFPLLFLLSYIAHLILTISSLLLSLPTSLLPHYSPFSPDITLSLSLLTSISLSLSLSLYFPFSLPTSVPIHVLYTILCFSPIHNTSVYLMYYSQMFYSSPRSQSSYASNYHTCETHNATAVRFFHVNLILESKWLTNHECLLTVLP